MKSYFVGCPKMISITGQKGWHKIIMLSMETSGMCISEESQFWHSEPIVHFGCLPSLKWTLLVLTKSPSSRTKKMWLLPVFGWADNRTPCVISTQCPRDLASPPSSAKSESAGWAAWAESSRSKKNCSLCYKKPSKTQKTESICNHFDFSWWSSVSPLG